MQKGERGSAIDLDELKSDTCHDTSRRGFGP